MPPRSTARATLLRLSALLLAATACSSSDEPTGLTDGISAGVSEVIVSPTVDTIFVRDTITAADTVQLRARVVGFSGAVITTPVRWSATDTGAVRVDSTGTVRPRQLGEATVTARAGNKTATARVVVASATARLVLQNAAGVSTGRDTLFTGTTIGPSDARRLRVFALGAQGDTLTGVRYVWTSSVPSVATVDSTGTVRPAAPGAYGTTTITVTGGGLTATRTIEVRSVVRTVQVSGAPARVAVGDTLQLRAAVLGYAGETLTGIPVTWQSSNPAVATVDNNGLARIVGPGQVQFTATAAFTNGQLAAPASAEAFALTSVDAGWDHTCAVTTLGRPYCWGRRAEGQLGMTPRDTVCYDDEVPSGPFACSLVPKRADSTVAGFTSVASGAFFTCGVSTTQRGYCWGSGQSGQLGNGRAATSLTPTLVTSVPTFTRISTGGVGAFGNTPNGAHACGITGAGTLFCWGSDAAGQLGNGFPLDSSTTPVRVDDGTQWRDVSAGRAHTCAVRTDGAVFCWGRNTAGQVSGSATAVVDSLRPVPLPESATQVSASEGGHSCALGASGAVYCWGSNANGELGAGTSGDSTGTPRTVIGGRSFRQIATGDGFTCGLSGNAVLCWGRGNYGQLGSRTATANQPVPVDDARTIDPASGEARTVPASFTSITAGRRHACALGADGRAYCWGSDVLGALGTQFQARAERYPVQVSLPGPLRP